MTIMRWRDLVPVAAFASLVTVLSSLPAAAQDEAAPLALLKTMPVGGAGKWDYLYADARNRRLYVPRSTHTQVLDLDTGAVLGDIPDTKGVHGVALAPDQGLGFTSNGGDGTVTAFDLKTFKVAKIIKAGTKPDPIMYDRATKHILVINHGGGTVSVIDPADLEKEPVTIPVGGTLEFAVGDGAGHVFVNVEDKDETVEIDSKENKVLAHWPVAPGQGPAGLAIDARNHRLFVGCANEKLIVLDAESGKVLASPTIGKGCDGVVFNRRLGGALASCGKDAAVCVVKETSPGKFETVQTVQTIKGAKTIAVERHQACGRAAVQRARRQGRRNVRHRRRWPERGSQVRCATLRNVPSPFERASRTESPHPTLSRRERGRLLL